MLYVNKPRAVQTFVARVHDVSDVFLWSAKFKIISRDFKIFEFFDFDGLGHGSGRLGLGLLTDCKCIVNQLIDWKRDLTDKKQVF